MRELSRYQLPGLQGTEWQTEAGVRGMSPARFLTCLIDDLTSLCYVWLLGFWAYIPEHMGGLLHLLFVIIFDVLAVT